MKEFSAEIIEANRGGALIEIPFDVKQEYGKGRVPIIATFDGIEYKGSLVKMSGRYILGIKKEIRSKLNKNIGDQVTVTLIEDTQPRTVVIPEGLQNALNQNKLALKNFNKLSYSHKKEYVNWINEAKKEETRIKRIDRTLEKLV